MVTRFGAPWVVIVVAITTAVFPDTPGVGSGLEHSASAAEGRTRSKRGSRSVID